MTIRRKDREPRNERYRPNKVLWIVILGLIAMGFWASTYRIDQVVRGQGSFIATSRVQVVQAVDGGVIKALRVKEGNRVEAGQVLAELDRTRTTASVQELEGRLAALYAKAARLRAELAGNDQVTFPPSLQKFPDIVKVERALFVQRLISFREEMHTLQVAVRLAKEDAKIVTDLAKTGDVSRSEVIKAQRALNEAEAQYVNRKNKYLQDARTELAKVEDDLGQNEQVRNQRAQQLQDTIITAAVPGIVKNMRLTTPGSVLKAGEELLQIVPVNDEMLLEVKVKPADMADLRIGLPANIRVDAYDYTIFGTLSGEVVYISADTLKEDSRLGEQVFYRVHVGIKSGPVMTQTGKPVDIIPGMTSQVDIRTGDRTVLQYILKPLRKTWTESLGER